MANRDLLMSSCRYNSAPARAAESTGPHNLKLTLLPVVVREHGVLQDGIGHLGRTPRKLISNSLVCKYPSSGLLPPRGFQQEGGGFESG